MTALPSCAAKKVFPAMSEPRQPWALAVHGGAGAIDPKRMTAQREAEIRAGLAGALAAGEAILAKDGTALDAVEAAVRVLEDDPNFNAGRGAVFSAEGQNELDAAIMDGRDRRAGAIAGVTRTRNPVTLARRVMEASPHVLLIGKGADRFSSEQGLDQVDPEYFRTEERWQQLEKLRAGTKTGGTFDADVKYGTVGAVARDAHGHLAAATSTGGLTGKRWGRVGDTPLIGAGTYADDRGCAVSATGLGEVYIRVGVAHEICAQIRFNGSSPRIAADAVQAEVKALGGTGGVIVVGREGLPIWSFNSFGMYRGVVAQNSQAVVELYAEDELQR